MIEKEGPQFFTETFNNPKSRIQFHQEIYEGLGLGEAGFLKVPDFIETMIIDNIATDLINLSEYLEIPLPEVGLTMQWNSNNPQKIGEYSIADIVASATVDDYYKEGIVRYSPFYLKSYISSKLHIEQDVSHPPLPLSIINAHEAFHLWQYINQKNKILKDILIMNEKGLDQWSLTQTEVDAMEFGKRWFERTFI